MRIARIGACLAAVACCAFAIWKGAELLAFARLGERASSYSAMVRSGKAADPDRAAALDRDLRAWSEVWGLRTAARTRAADLQTVSISTLSVDRLERDSASVLSVDPLNGRFWMKLANARLLSGKSLEAVVAAFDMAVLTTPLESNVLYERVEFGFAFWEILPADRRDRIAADFVAFHRQMIPAGLGGKEAGWLAFIIASKNESIRVDMRDHIHRRAGSDINWLKRFGL